MILSVTALGIDDFSSVSMSLWRFLPIASACTCQKCVCLFTWCVCITEPCNMIRYVFLVAHICRTNSNHAWSPTLNWINVLLLNACFLHADVNIMGVQADLESGKKNLLFPIIIIAMSILKFQFPVPEWFLCHINFQRILWSKLNGQISNLSFLSVPNLPGVVLCNNWRHTIIRFRVPGPLTAHVKQWKAGSGLETRLVNAMFV